MELIARHFEAFPPETAGHEALWPCLSRLVEVRFPGSVSKSNSNQITTLFDNRLQKALIELGARPTKFELTGSISKEYDFALTIDGHLVVVEVEKSNREKILYDILKCHMYLNGGADFALLVLPKNYPHRHGEWDLYGMGMTRYAQCVQYGFGTKEVFDRIMLLGYEQGTSSGERLTSKVRQRLIDQHLLQSGEN